MFQSCNALHGSHKFNPGVALLLQDEAACRRELVIAAAALAGFFHPAALDPAALLQPVQQRIKRRDVEGERAVRLLLNELADFIAVARTGFQQGKDEQLSAAFLEFAMEQRQWLWHIW